MRIITTENQKPRSIDWSIGSIRSAPILTMLFSPESPIRNFLHGYKVKQRRCVSNSLVWFVWVYIINVLIQAPLNWSWIHTIGFLVVWNSVLWLNNLHSCFQTWYVVYLQLLLPGALSQNGMPEQLPFCLVNSLGLLHWGKHFYCQHKLLLVSWF